MPDSTPRDPHTFVSQVLASWARESELKQVAELTKSPLVNQDMLNAQLFNLPEVSQWQYKRNVLRIILSCVVTGSNGFREHARGNAFWLIGVLLRTPEIQQETAEQDLFVQHVQQIVWRTRGELSDSLNHLIRTIKGQSVRKSIDRANRLMQLSVTGGAHLDLLHRLQQSYNIFHTAALLAFQPIPVANGVDGGARAALQVPLAVLDVLSDLIRCIAHVEADSAYHKRLLEACGDDAQRIMYGLQAALDAHARGYSSFTTAPVLRLFQDLSSRTGLLPKDYWLPGIEEGEKIAAGGEAEIFKGIRLINSRQETVALRRIRHQEDGGVAKVIRREAITHKQLRHPNILPFLGLFKTKTSPAAIITPWAPNGDAFEYMKQNPMPDRFMRITLGISSALAYIHKLDPPVIHGDIRARNVLIDIGGNPQLCDFGLSRIKHEITRTQTSISVGGYMRHMAPELSEVVDFRTTPESDVFSFAMTIYELGTQSLPFAHVKNEHAAARMIQEQKRPEQPPNLAGLDSSFTARVWSLVVQMWAADQKLRPPAESVRSDLRKIDAERNSGRAVDPRPVPSSRLPEPAHTEATDVSSVSSIITSLTSTHISTPPVSEHNHPPVTPSSNPASNSPRLPAEQPREWNQEILIGHEDHVVSIAYPSSGDNFASASRDGYIYIWYRDQHGAWTSRPERNNNLKKLSCISYTFDARFLAAGTFDAIKLWDVSTSRAAGSFNRHARTVTALASSPTRQQFASGSKDYTVFLWDSRTRENIGTQMIGHGGDITSIAFSPSGNTVASASLDGALRLWDVRMDRWIGICHKFEHKVAGVSYSPEGCIAAACEDKNIYRWNTGATRFGTLVGHQAAVKCLAFSPDGTQIASGSVDNTIRMWDASSGVSAGAPLTGHTGTIESIAFSQDRGHLVSASRDKTVRVWSRGASLPRG